MEARREVTLRRECRRRAGWLHAIEATARGRTVSEPRLQNSPVFAASLHRLAVFQPPTRQVMTDAIAVGAFFSIVDRARDVDEWEKEGKERRGRVSIPGRTPSLVFDLRLAWIASSPSTLWLWWCGVSESLGGRFLPGGNHSCRVPSLTTGPGGLVAAIRSTRPQVRSPLMQCWQGSGWWPVDLLMACRGQ